MKKILLIIILIFSFQSFTNAEDISEFEIEGMSIGDSLLDFVSESYIKNNFGKWHDDEFHQLLLTNFWSSPSCR